MSDQTCLIVFFVIMIVYGVTGYTVCNDDDTAQLCVLLSLPFLGLALVALYVMVKIFCSLGGL